MKKFWSGEETRRNGDELFRVKVVGSNPAGPTTRRTGPARAKIFGTLWELKKKEYKWLHGTDNPFEIFVEEYKRQTGKEMPIVSLDTYK